MIASASRLRVLRILRDDYTNEDITSLLLTLRDLAGGREALKEVGDFVAHRSERTKGLTTREAKDFFAVLRHHAQAVEKPEKERFLWLDNLPPNFPQILRATFQRIDSRSLKHATGLKRPAAYRLLEEVTGNIIQDRDGRHVLT